MLDELGERQCRLMADFFSAMSNSTRLHMLCALQTGPKTVSELAEYAEVSMPNASQHLRVMREKGVVTMEKEAQFVYYTVADPRIIKGASMIRTALTDVARRNAQWMDVDAE
ncbi:metalloregulator ArsR/SmtB family transcription factor [Planctomycetes bacterium CA13]|uniref:ArsR/SmtB family transcription factor n=1 Tax=Novipirellula herctigrandis TaxID=2527986 RepID=UPI0011B8564C